MSSHWRCFPMRDELSTTNITGAFGVRSPFDPGSAPLLLCVLWCVARSCASALRGQRLPSGQPGLYDFAPCRSSSTPLRESTRASTLTHSKRHWHDAAKRISARPSVSKSEKTARVRLGACDRVRSVPSSMTSFTDECRRAWVA
eukprot:6210654-Pleurochrysis_carterae.AAC.2